MHELSITENVLRLALTHAEKAEAQRIITIYLVVGDLTGISEDSVRLYFEVLSRGTMAEQATLHFQRVPTRLRCHQCGREFEPQDMAWRCPFCQMLGGEVIAGREFYLESIEVE